MNAALQALWASNSIKNVLRDIYDSLPAAYARADSASNARPRRPAVRPATLRLAHITKRQAPERAEETYLSTLFRYAFSGDMTKPLYPHTLGDHFYKGHQEDPAELLEAFLLDDHCSPTLHGLARIHFTSPLCCTNCSCVHPSNQFQETLFSLPIQIDATADAPQQTFHTVQEAFDAFLRGETVERREACDDCKRQDMTYAKPVHTLRYPPVLVLTLKRFAYLPRSDGGYTDHYITHPVEATETLTYDDNAYYLRSFIMHQGCSRHAGHYFTIARHDTPNGRWWLYNDADRREANADELLGTASVRNQPMRTYVLFYERQ